MAANRPYNLDTKFIWILEGRAGYIQCILLGYFKSPLFGENEIMPRPLSGRHLLHHDEARPQARGGGAGAHVQVLRPERPVPPLQDRLEQPRHRPAPPRPLSGQHDQHEEVLSPRIKSEFTRMPFV